MAFTSLDAYVLYVPALYFKHLCRCYIFHMDKKYNVMKLLADDITCTSCAEDMELILRETEGIVDAAVNYNEDTISVRYDPEIIDRKKVYLAVRKLGPIKKILSES